jgi:hypothetical protein
MIGRNISIGPDGVPGAILKVGAEAMLPYLARLLDITINNGTVRRDWGKKTIVVPIHKEVLCIVLCRLCCSIYCLRVNVYYCHRVSTQLQLNISYHIILHCMNPFPVCCVHNALHESVSVLLCS